ncbi:MAG: accessory Sec system protein translocase subunit SecY2 [Lachnospiraceae bacterium]|nr:accessory Sec system protein translocase subunit SecY2 [Lachnospiraceae bacterium]
MQFGRKDSILKYKLLYTALVLFIYLLGKNLPLYGIDLSAYANQTLDTAALLIQAISGDVYRRSVFALGISPYMMASILVQMVVAFRSADAKARISPKKKNYIMLELTLIFALFQAVLQVRNLSFAVTGQRLMLAQVVSVVEMIAGAMIILWLSEQNKKYGVGGQTALIFVNILEGIVAILTKGSMESLVIPLLISLIVIMIMVILENAEKRIPVQRISIHNIYADKNYLAIKLNPIGVMPVMFSTAFFMLPQLLVTGLAWLFPGQETIIWWQENLVLTKPLGVIVYIAILYALTIGFSRVFLNPTETTEQFLKSGDSLVGIHAGRDTKRYLSRNITRISLFSATALSLCLSVPMVMQLNGYMDNSLSALPTSIMMLTGIWSNLYREVLSIRDMDAYEPFI